ncbi:MAG: hypothetical protein FWC51_03630 [Proteobacteria bacterium]|nr:hypothetical protein [Pseudomonadota bacterium]
MSRCKDDSGVFLMRLATIGFALLTIITVSVRNHDEGNLARQAKEIMNQSGFTKSIIYDPSISTDSAEQILNKETSRLVDSLKIAKEQTLSRTRLINAYQKQ